MVKKLIIKEFINSDNELDDDCNMFIEYNYTDHHEFFIVKSNYSVGLFNDILFVFDGDELKFRKSIKDIVFMFSYKEW